MWQIARTQYLGYFIGGLRSYNHSRLRTFKQNRFHAMQLASDTEAELRCSCRKRKTELNAIKQRDGFMDWVRHGCVTHNRSEYLIGSDLFVYIRTELFKGIAAKSHSTGGGASMGVVSS